MLKEIARNIFMGSVGLAAAGCLAAAVMFDNTTFALAGIGWAILLLGEQIEPNRNSP